jgi:uncharacterized phosphosugar-binding protein
MGLDSLPFRSAINKSRFGGILSASAYRERLAEVMTAIWATQLGNIERAAAIMAESIAAGGLVHVFGSGHSVLPVQDIFPRYGGYPGWHPLMDARLMWTNVLGSGGAKGLLWLERREGYAPILFENQPVREGDVMLVFSHGGLNAVAIEVAIHARKLGMKVVGVTSLDNHRRNQATHSSGQKLADVVDLVIDNCVPAQDALVNVESWKAPVAAGSTAAFVTIAMALVAQVAAELAKRGVSLPVFVSPNVEGLSPDNNQRVFEAYQGSLDRKLWNPQSAVPQPGK